MATIGAISKLVTTGIYRIDQVRHVVLDEADTLLGKPYKIIVDICINNYIFLLINVYLDDSFTDKLCHFLKKFQVGGFLIHKYSIYLY